LFPQGPKLLYGKTILFEKASSSADFVAGHEVLASLPTPARLWVDESRGSGELQRLPATCKSHHCCCYCYCCYAIVLGYGFVLFFPPPFPPPLAVLAAGNQRNVTCVACFLCFCPVPQDEFLISGARRKKMRPAARSKEPPTTRSPRISSGAVAGFWFLLGSRRWYKFLLAHYKLPSCLKMCACVGWSLHIM